MGIARQERPNASAQKKAAFANSVAYLVTECSGGYGGPSVREHAVAHTYIAKPYSFERALELLLDENGLIFGPLREIHFYCFRHEHCFNDDSDDLIVLQGRLHAQSNVGQLAEE